ncbi:hypothetical protein CN395_27945 [Priestia megaterium]|uniref:hypothetical protein n=1 Tax=Priestia megaterium TaxID=1404 RepID=UPI000BF6BA52|nr:hypothetical protein [Priestia megaterium]PEU52192.1 hypothetical protein CN395_27945 [Priestia megaterium]
MKIFTLEGLPLAGKSTTGTIICEYFNNIGIKSVYKHGQITDNYKAQNCIHKAFQCLEKWDYKNPEYLFDFIKYRYEQLHIDFFEFHNHLDRYMDVEYLFIDRYIGGHNITASTFGYDIPNSDISSKFDELLTMEILLTCDYEERKKRAMIREKTNNLTEYSLLTKEIHSFMQDQHILSSQANKKSRIISSHSYEKLKKDIIGEINERILL